MKVPCGKLCPDRTAECKKTCPKWQEYEKEYFEKRKEIQDKAHLARDFYAIKNHAFSHNKKKR